MVRWSDYHTWRRLQGTVCFVDGIFRQEGPSPHLSAAPMTVHIKGADISFFAEEGLEPSDDRLAFCEHPNSRSDVRLGMIRKLYLDPF